MVTRSTLLGIASLCLSIVGVVPIVFCPNLVDSFRMALQADEFLENSLWVVLGVLLELAALACGIGAGHTNTRKTGLIISSVVLLICLVFALFFFATQPPRI
jgi:hypothetical protein